MAYIGRDISNLSDRAVLDNITASATATYNLLLNSVAYVPSSAESLTVSLNGVIQKPQSSYTVSGSTIVFDSALTSSDSIDFILAERAITLTTVGSGSVGLNQLSATGTKDATTFLRGDNTFATVTSTTINNNADNRVITGSGTANTLEGESNLFYDGTDLGIGTSSPDGSSFSASSSPVVDVSGTRPLIILSETDANTKKAWFGLSSDVLYVGGTNTETKFYTDNSEKMSIDSSGVDITGTLQVNGSAVGAGQTKAWVNFEMVGTFSVRDSFNVSSISDEGTGDVNVNFTTAFANDDYCAGGVTRFSSSNTNANVCYRGVSNPLSTTTAQMAVRGMTNNSASDSDYVTIIFSGDQ